MSEKTALITGAARRLGAASARALHGAGYRIAIHYRSSAADAGLLQDELNGQRPGSAIIIGADLNDTAGLPALVETTRDAFGRLDLLLNNASSFYPTPFGSVTEAQWDDLVGSNLKAPLFLSQAAAPLLRQSRGVIINMVDIHGQRPLARHPVYCSAKAGLIMLTLSLARELGPDIRVNGIAPGPIMWPETGVTESEKAGIIAATALQRTGTPDDIASTVVFLARDASYVTGQIIAVDGGRSLG